MGPSRRFNAPDRETRFEQLRARLALRTASPNIGRGGGSKTRESAHRPRSDARRGHSDTRRFDPLHHALDGWYWQPASSVNVSVTPRVPIAAETFTDVNTQ